LRKNSKDSPQLGPRRKGSVPVLAVTMGDARGIGPEVLLKAIAHPGLQGEFEPVIVGVPQVLEHEAETLWPGKNKVPQAVHEALAHVVDISQAQDNFLYELEPERLRNYLAGEPGICGRWAGRAVEKAVELASGGRVDAVVTAPLDKHALNLGGYPYPGHTEMLAHLAGDVEVSMMLVGDNLRVVPATTHVALAQVSSLITVELLLGQCRLIHRGLEELFGIRRPRIALCGLNPHLGDGGVAGDEDQKVTAVAAEAARSSGLNVLGPFPADTVFVRAVRGEFDAVLAMYHDQAMIAVKMHAFGRGVNLTLGLPFIRSSPDHGTALDIAGKGCADETSMVQALRVAIELSRKKRRGGKG